MTMRIYSLQSQMISLTPTYDLYDPNDDLCPGSLKDACSIILRLHGISLTTLTDKIYKATKLFHNNPKGSLGCDDAGGWFIVPIGGMPGLMPAPNMTG